MRAQACLFINRTLQSLRSLVRVTYHLRREAYGQNKWRKATISRKNAGVAMTAEKAWYQTAA